MEIRNLTDDERDKYYEQLEEFMSYENKNHSDEVKVNCKLNQNFNKWEPFESSNENISTI